MHNTQYDKHIVFLLSILATFLSSLHKNKVRLIEGKTHCSVLCLHQFNHIVAGLAITSTDLLPNYALRHAIGRWAVGHNIKLPEPENIPQIQAGNIMTPTQKLLEWGQTLPDLQAPITVAVAKLYRGTRKEQVETIITNKNLD